MEPSTSEPAVRLIPLGGLGEIGLNMMLVEFGDDVVAVDCGLMFPDPDEMPGIDYVIPDFSYAVAKRDGFRAVLLTHGHEDHIGALPYLLRTTRIPVYGTPLTLALVAEKLREHNLLETADLRPMKPHDRIEAGPFRIEPIRVTHSIADGIGLAIDTPVGTIVHTGDFKLDPSPLDGETPDYKRFTELGEHGVLLLCSDSTNVGRPGHTRSELDVGVALRERFQRASGRIVVATFASHIHRIQQVLTLAAEHGRRVALLGMSMEKNVRVASDLGYLRVPADLVMPLDDLVALPPGRQVILSTGSQGEPNSALSLLATGEHRAMQVERGDLVIISARVIPGNERTIGRVINALLRRGADVLYEDNAFVHVSGHASQEDLKLMLNLTRPRYFMPVHGEYRHLLGHARLAESVGLASDRVFLVEDGAVVEMTKTAARVIGHLPVDRVLVDGKGIGDIGSVVLRDRQILAESGLVAVSLVIDRTGRVVSGPEIASRGFVYMQENRPLIDEIKQAVMDAVTGRDPATPGDREAIGALVRTTVRQFINQRFQRKPIVLPIILEV
ncbi:MAG: ribonuclease J [Candidatus Rokubacteria bacterium 13_1_20CM_2_68_19]|nr:MAG: ribonuclease J [Candidatus Rokubacteria bacterium 13_2_20CM_69_10]OLE45507.1 MAG: ribonuclease J [Candidatus Rokubacteria bacterium 13_1_20CM_2_68_19]